MKRLSFAIVGGGPAGFYIGKCLTKLPQQPIIHMFQKEYCPFGLIRYGVAPDHISIKKSQTTLSSLSNYSRFRYHGNQPINQDLLSQLKSNYSGVIYAFGAQGNNQPNWFRTWKAQAKNTSNVLNARDVVYWYNNHPQYESYSLNLSQTENVVIIGNGNVAIDISRIFLKRPQELINTQISINALKSLRESKIRNVTLIGRRGFTHSAFALKELRQISHFKIGVYCIEEELQKSMNQSSYIQCTSLGDHNAVVVRMNKRKIDFIKQKCHIIKKAELPYIMEKKDPKIILRYLLDPIQISKEKQLKCLTTQLKGEPFKQTVVRTEKQELIPFDILINSTGFKVSSIDPSELDEKGNRIINSNGCVLQGNDVNKVKIGNYSVGWCKNGPRGVIDETLLSSQQTFNNIRIHVKNKVILQKQIPSFSSNNQISFQKYLKLKEIQLAGGDKEKFIKKKLNSKQIQQFFSK